MSFQKKITIRYFIQLLVIILLFSIIIMWYILYQMEQTATQDMLFVCNNLSDQLDSEINKMVFATDFFLSDAEILTAVHLLATSTRTTPEEQTLIYQGKSAIRRLLTNHLIDRSYYRFSYFNPKGDFLTSEFRRETIYDGQVKVENYPWLAISDSAKGRFRIVPPMTDPWTSSGEITFSILRRIQGNENLGYLHVQQPYSSLEDLFALPDTSPTRDVIVVNTRGDILYSSLVEVPIIDYLLENTSFHIANGTSQTDKSKDMIVVSSYSPYTDYHVVLLQNRSTILSNFLPASLIIILLTIALLVFSLAYVSITAHRLTQPIRQLRDIVKNTNLHNIEDTNAISIHNDEVQSLQAAYSELIQRLQTAIEKESVLSSLQILAHFDSLQAQINPHFLYNVLNVISHRGVINKDEIICDICDKLAAMLQYSTNTSSRYASVSQEIHHLENYIFLLKTRYKDRFTCAIHISPDIKAQTLPKLVLQQIVENSINHGFSNVSGIMKISIEGHQANEKWFIRIEDNGSGFSPTVLEELTAEMEAQRRRISSPGFSDITGGKIGGMGLINTYARLYILYQENLHFSIGNNDNGSAVVEFGSAMGPLE